jgi:hypothetical protein
MAMLIGFGFGSPMVSILMLIVTSALSYLIFRSMRQKLAKRTMTRAERRQYYYEQRRRASEFAREYDLTDEEIERKIDEECCEE